ncbi:MAG: tetratricopeptide repeat protein [Bacteroidetes bacterium]|nr:tetratricopeptide repeat protein [Bacteroidota bacterium]
MEGSNEVMNGVTLLLNVVQTSPSHYGANLLLGKFGIVSGQYEKAIARLEKVVSLQSEKIEGYFLLADAYGK